MDKKRIQVVFSVSVLIALLGCEQEKNLDSLEKSITSNGYGVEKLFENDGCLMYRFYDENHYRYFAKCGKQKQIAEEHTDNCGKGCSSISKTMIQE